MVSRARFLEWLAQIYATADVELDCDQTQALLAPYIEAELAGAGVEARLARVRSHLIHCPDCTDEYTALRQVVELEAQNARPTVEALLAQFPAGSPARMAKSPAAGA